MHLTAANLAHFLIGRGLVYPGEVVAGELSIVESSRRNRNFKVSRRCAPGLFVKQMRDAQADAIVTLRREAACYEAARYDAALGQLLPRLIAYEPGRHVLIIELLGDAESLADYHARQREFPAEVGRMLGEGLGQYHTQATALVENPTLQSLLARRVPVILTLDHGGDAALRHFGQIGPAAVSLLQQHDALRDLLGSLGTDWRPDSLIHGDMKWDNVLVFPKSSGELGFKIVDWEMADFGDAAWDVGAVLQSFLTVWIQSMPVASGLPPEVYVGMAELPLESMRPALRAFWTSYARTRAFSDESAKHELARSMRFAAARMVWTTIEHRLYTAQLDPTAMALMQVSQNILQDAPRAVAELIDV
jgi:Ser/Thr protein kinase RdoA (MazF antagonist)